MGKVGVGRHDMWQYIKKERKSLQHLVWVIKTIYKISILHSRKIQMRKLNLREICTQGARSK